jgi:hypothetical protein
MATETVDDNVHLLLLEEEDLEAAVAHLPTPPPEPKQPWERQAGEPPRAFHGFQHFRDQQIHSCYEAYKTHRKECMHLPVDHLFEAPKHWRVWSSQWGWVDRASAWDAEVDRQVRERLVVQQAEARERHARLAQAMLTVLSLPVKAALEAARDSTLVERMTEMAVGSVGGATNLIGQVARISSVVPSVVTMERLALGMSSDDVNIKDARDDDGISALVKSSTGASRQL